MKKEIYILAHILGTRVGCKRPLEATTITHFGSKRSIGLHYTEINDYKVTVIVIIVSVT